jgi:hypothetical protein
MKSGDLSVGPSTLRRLAQGKDEDTPRPLPMPFFPIGHSSIILLSDGNARATASVVKQPTALFWKAKFKTSKLRGLSPRANYTDRATAAWWRS